MTNSKPQSNTNSKHPAIIDRYSNRAVVFSTVQAIAAFNIYAVELLLCVAGPRCQWVRSMAEAQDFYLPGEPPLSVRHTEELRDSQDAHSKFLAERGRNTKQCRRCGTPMNTTDLNVEGTVHHNVPLECLDRKACERRKRKKRRKQQ